MGAADRGRVVLGPGRAVLLRVAAPVTLEQRAAEQAAAQSLDARQRELVTQLARVVPRTRG